MDEISEAQLLEYVAAGRALDGDDGGARRLVAAVLLRRLCHQLKDQVDPRGIRLRNAMVSGQLDIAGLDIPFPPRFEACEFDMPLMAEGAQLNELAVTGSAAQRAGGRDPDRGAGGQDRRRGGTQGTGGQRR